ncbi:MAG: YgiQ family radical SAM protein [Lachnospiraceae bacterium]|nr:YgiQ family radical SAM protein [Lachnospiraceae bacterium]
MKDFLPISQEDMKKRGWDEVDFVFVTGDAYVDHSSFGPAIISRVLEAHGYRVGMISQPDWTKAESVTVFGEPRLGFLVSAGNMDSMVNHYTVSKKRRMQDAYTPGGEAYKRPDYATIVYCNLIKKTYKKKPILIGGIEASLRRMGHYDYWSNKVKRSILMDSGADILMYGMGELAVVELADALAAGIPAEDITYVHGTVYKSKDVSDVLAGLRGKKGIELPEFSNIVEDKMAYAKSVQIQYENTDFATGRPLIEKYGEKRYIVQNPPMRPLTTQEFDDIYELPYMNAWHPSYDKQGGVPAFSEIKFSLTSNRGCFGGCSFCALTFHQGRVVQVRSEESLLREATAMTKEPDFKGNIYDVGGPTANFFRPACDKQLSHGACVKKQCMHPELCKNMKVDHSGYLALLRKMRNLPGVKKVFIRSGIRYDYILGDRDDTFFKELCKYHVSGQLRVAPEHVTDHVLDLMGKPRASVYHTFVQKYEKIKKELGLNQYIVPYLISSHPGSTLEDAVALAESIRDMGYMPEQVQDFYPTPATLSTCMYYTGVDPRNMKKVYVTTNPHEKAMQRALIQYRKPENYELVKEALLKTGRKDLIGFDFKTCLIPPRKMGDGPKGPGDKSPRKDGKPKGNSNGKNRENSRKTVPSHKSRKK